MSEPVVVSAVLIDKGRAAVIHGTKYIRADLCEDCGARTSSPVGLVYDSIIFKYDEEETILETYTL